MRWRWWWLGRRSRSGNWRRCRGGGGRLCRRLVGQRASQGQRVSQGRRRRQLRALRGLLRRVLWGVLGWSCLVRVIAVRLFVLCFGGLGADGTSRRRSCTGGQVLWNSPTCTVRRRKKLERPCLVCLPFDLSSLLANSLSGASISLLCSPRTAKLLSYATMRSPERWWTTYVRSTPLPPPANLPDRRSPPPTSPTRNPKSLPTSPT